MLVFAIKRLLMAIPTMLGVITIVFFAVRLLPGNPIMMMIPSGLPSAQESSYISRIEAQYGFNKPAYVQYVDYLGNLSQLHFGTSLVSQRKILPDLVQHSENTAQLGILALIIAVLVGVPAGIISAAKRDTWVDNVTMLGALVGISVPDFVLGFLLILIIALNWSLLPPSGFNGPIYASWDNFRYVILPAITLGFANAGILARFTRSSTLEVIHNDYVRTARAKGAGEWRVLYRHVLRNVLIPVVTVLGLQFGAILSGTVVVETVFGWPGIGRYVINAITSRNFPVVQAAVIVIALGFILGNLLTDMAYAVIDPRIRFD